MARIPIQARIHIVYTHKETHMLTHTHTYTDTHRLIHTHIQMHMETHRYTVTHMLMHTHTVTYTHSNTHIYKLPPPSPFPFPTPLLHPHVHLFPRSSFIWQPSSPITANPAIGQTVTNPRPLINSTPIRLEITDRKCECLTSA